MLTEKVFIPKLSPDFQVILDSTQDMICAFDNNYQLAYCNRAFSKNFELFINEPFDANITLDSYSGLERFNEFSDNWLSWINRAFSCEKFSEHFEYQISGKNLYYKLNFTPVIRNNNVAYIQITAHDETLKHNYEELFKSKNNKDECSKCISERQKVNNEIVKERDEAFELLKQNIQRLQMVFEGTSDGFWDYDVTKDRVFHSKHYYEILGFRNGEIKSDFNTWKSMIHKDDFDRVIASLNKHIDGSIEKYCCEYRLATKSGKYIWVLDKGKVVSRDEKNNALRIAGTISDISERKEIETKLLESEIQFNEITSVIGEGIFLIDSEWKLKFANPEFTRLLGYKTDDIINENLHDIIHSHSETDLKDCPLYKVLENGETIRVAEDYYLNKFGDLVPVSYVASPIKRKGKIVGCVAAFHDISNRITADEEVSRFVEELQFNKELMEENASEFARLNEMLAESEVNLTSLNASKDKLFSIISHDLRSPFTSIIGFAEVMLEDLDSLSKEEIKDFTGSIYKSSKNVQNLLENLLQWSRVQTGRIEFNPRSFNLKNLVSDILALFEVNAARKKISLTNKMEDEFEITADRFMLDTIFRNLVSNAIKFTHAKGEIVIEANETENNFIHISISDSGVGMKKEILEKLFKIDCQVTTKGTDKEKGTGLGLILCKEFTIQHGGKIWVESEENVGSKFNITIPKKNLN